MRISKFIPCSFPVSFKVLILLYLVIHLKAFFMFTFKRLKGCILLFIALPIMLSGQTVTKSVVVLNGGAYSNPGDFVTLSDYNPETGVTQNIATIFSHSVQGMLVHNGFAYVAAQDSLAKVEIETGEISSIVALAGVNKFAVYNDMLIVSRQFPVTSGFVQVRLIEDLSLVTTFDEISDESWEITVAGDTAYVSVAGGWAATKGKLAVIDMKNLDFVREMDLGLQALGIGPSFVDGEHLFLVCKTPWGGTNGTIIKYNLLTSTYSLHQSEHAFGKAAGIFNNELFLIIDGNIGTFNLPTLEVENENLISNPFSNLDITALAIDTISERLYVNYSYWVAPDGVGKIYDLSGYELGEYEVGISAEEVAVNYADVTSVHEVEGDDFKPEIFPNPCSAYLNIAALPTGASIEIFNQAGLKVYSGRLGPGNSRFIDVADFPTGLFLLKVSPDNGQEHIIKFIHQ
jgi:hypothetical protein